MDTMFNRLILLLVLVSLCWTSIAWDGGAMLDSRVSPSSREVTPSQASADWWSKVWQVVERKRIPLADGRYTVQQVIYRDIDGEYTVFLLNASPSKIQTRDLKMARLTDEEIENDQEPYLELGARGAALHIGPAFRVEYIHGIAESRGDPMTGETERVITRREANFWTPFAASLLGNLTTQVIGNAPLTPQYVIPPSYQPGEQLVGIGGHGSTRDRAVESYRQRYQETPTAVKNRRAQLRTTGNLNSTRSKTSSSSRPSSSSSRSTGSGVGSSALRSSGKSSSRSGRSSFGSSRSGWSRSRGFGSRRR